MIVTIIIEGATRHLTDLEEFNISLMLIDKLGVDDLDTEAVFEYEDE